MRYHNVFIKCSNTEWKTKCIFLKWRNNWKPKKDLCSKEFNKNETYINITIIYYMKKRKGKQKKQIIT